MTIQSAQNIPKKISDEVHNYIKSFEELSEKGVGFYFHSNEPGSGKTSYMKAMLEEIIAQYGIRIYFESLVEIKSQLKSEFDQDMKGRTSLREKLKTLPVLAIDDIGSEVGSEWLNEIMKEVIDYRYNNMLTTHFTSNLSIEALPFPKKIRDRIRGMCKPIHFPEISLRSLGK